MPVDAQSDQIARTQRRERVERALLRHVSDQGAAAAGRGPPARRRGRIVFWLLFGLAVAAVVAGQVVGIVSVRIYTDPSTSMEPTIKSGAAS